MYRICTTWVPHFLMCEQMEQCVEKAKEWVQRVRRDCNFLSKVITCDETWVHYFDLKSKCESEIWRTYSSLKTKKVHQQKSAGKPKLWVFFDLRESFKINAIYYYVQVLKSLQKHINKKRLETACLWILHQDNAR